MHSEQDWDEKHQQTIMTGQSPPRRPPPAFSIASSSLADEKTALAECARGTSCVSTFTTDEEKGVLGREMTDEEVYTAAAQPQQSQLPSPKRQSHAPRHTNTTPSTTSRHTVRQYDDQDEDAMDQRLERKAVKLLLLFSGPLFALSLVLALWTIVAFFVTCLVFPIRRIVANNTSLRTSLSSLTTSTLNIHLRVIYAIPLDSTDVHMPLALLVHLLNPVLAGGLAIWAWVAAFYWLCSAIVGNPDGLDGRNDGRELVLSTRRWWESWLLVAGGR